MADKPAVHKPVMDALARFLLPKREIAQAIEEQRASGKDLRARLTDAAVRRCTQGNVRIQMGRYTTQEEADARMARFLHRHSEGGCSGEGLEPVQRYSSPPEKYGSKAVRYTTPEEAEKRRDELLRRYARKV